MLEIAISGLLPPESGDFAVEIDEYVPLRMRSYSRKCDVPIALRTGNFDTSILEFDVDPMTCGLHGVTLVCFDQLAPVWETGVLPTERGLPVVMMPGRNEFEGPDHALRFDRNGAFAVGIGVDFIEVDFAGLSSSTKIIENGQAQFYLRENQLTGLRVSGLSSKQIALMRFRNPPKK